MEGRMLEYSSRLHLGREDGTSMVCGRRESYLLVTSSSNINGSGSVETLVGRGSVGKMLTGSVYSEQVSVSMCSGRLNILNTTVNIVLGLMS
jgi:hypothetical protein